jgi:hypothetical protein
MTDLGCPCLWLRTWACSRAAAAAPARFRNICGGRHVFDGVLLLKGVSQEGGRVAR